jgi:hypothetical protein
MWVDGHIGNSNFSNFDPWFFLSTNVRPDKPNSPKFGYAWVGSIGHTYLYEDYINEPGADRWTQEPLGAGNINYLLYKDGEPPLYKVIEPSSLTIFALGIMGLASRRFKK